MKQFATGTAVLKTPRPITFELAFFFFFNAVVVAAAAACKMSHILFLPGRGRSSTAGLPRRAGSGDLDKTQEFGAWVVHD